jgi:hypothetical protein
MSYLLGKSCKNSVLNLRELPAKAPEKEKERKKSVSNHIIVKTIGCGNSLELN